MKASVSGRSRASYITIIAILGAFAALVPGKFAQTHVANPFVGAIQYLNPDYTAEVQAVIATTTDPTLAGQMKTVTTFPTAVWMDHIGAIAGGAGRMSLQQHLQTALTQSGGQPIVVTLVIYDLPDRDCAALASNGELSIAATGTPPQGALDGITAYKTLYIDAINAVISSPAFANIRFVLVIEPDSLPNLVTNTGLSFTLANCVAAQAAVTGAPNGVYEAGIQYALNTFSALPNAYLYLDIGHSAWLGWNNNAAGAVTLYTNVVKGTTRGFASVAGFIDDTANYTPLQEPFITGTQTLNGIQVISSTFYSYNPTVDEQGFATELQGLFRAAGWPTSSTNFITDTSRNGWGGPNRPVAASTSTDVNTYVNASRIDRRNHRGQWCNQEGAGMGIPPLAAPPNFPQFQAYVWIKPPGESDGTYPGSANQDGAVHADPNCNPASTNPLAGGTLTGSIPNSPPAGQFFPTELIMNIQNADPVVPSTQTKDFSLSGNGTSVEQGGIATTSITVLPVLGFNSAVSLSVSGLPAGVTAAFSPATVAGGSGVSTLTFTAAANATVPAAPVPLIVTGTGGGITHTFAISLTVIGRPDFSLTIAPPATVTINPGTNPTIGITVGALFGFTGTVSVQASGLPAGVQANFSPNSVNGSGTITANFSDQSSTPAGTCTVTITGTSGQGATALTHSATLALTIPPVGGGSFTLTVPNVTVPRGGSATATGTLQDIAPFAGAVTLSMSGLPAGLTVTLPPAPITAGSFTLTFTASATATVGAFTVTLTGASGAITQTATFILTVTSTPDFSIAGTNASAIQGHTAASTITVAPIGAFTGTVALSVGALPAGVTATLASASITGGAGTSTLTFTASAAAAVGATPVVITGVSGALTHTATITLTVTRTADFSLAGTNPTVAQGGTGAGTITVTPIGTFTGSVALSVGTLPAGVTASFNPTSTTTTSTLTFTASATAAAGSTALTITGVSGTLTHTVSITLTVTTGHQGNVTIATVINSNSPYYDDEGIHVSSTSGITALSVTITVQNTGGISFSSMYNTVGSSIAQSHSSTASAITYQFNLSAGQTLAPGTTYLFDAQMGGTGTVHPTTGDTYTVTYTAGGVAGTQSGHF